MVDFTHKMWYNVCGENRTNVLYIACVVVSICSVPLIVLLDVWFSLSAFTFYTELFIMSKITFDFFNLHIVIFISKIDPRKPNRVDLTGTTLS